MLYPSIFIYNYIWLFLKNAKKARKRAKQQDRKARKNGIGLKPIPLPCSLAYILGANEADATFGVFARFTS